jgi:hypothetical protein
MSESKQVLTAAEKATQALEAQLEKLKVTTGDSLLAKDLRSYGRKAKLMAAEDSLWVKTEMADKLEAAALEGRRRAARQAVSLTADDIALFSKAAVVKAACGVPKQTPAERAAATLANTNALAAAKAAEVAAVIAIQTADPTEPVVIPATVEVKAAKAKRLPAIKAAAAATNPAKAGSF